MTTSLAACSSAQTLSLWERNLFLKPNLNLTCGAIPSDPIAGRKSEEIGACPSSSPHEDLEDHYEVTPQSPPGRTNQVIRATALKASPPHLSLDPHRIVWLARELKALIFPASCPEQDPDRFIGPRRRMSSCPWSVKSVGRMGLQEVPPPGDIQLLLEVF
ncbi:uncharacterized protein M8220_016151 isoform 1-T1 [Acridotheres tristis]